MDFDPEKNASVGGLMLCYEIQSREVSTCLI